MSFLPEARATFEAPFYVRYKPNIFLRRLNALSQVGYGMYSGIYRDFWHTADATSGAALPRPKMPAARLAFRVKDAGTLIAGLVDLSPENKCLVSAANCCSPIINQFAKGCARNNNLRPSLGYELFNQHCCSISLRGFGGADLVF